MSKKIVWGPRCLCIFHESAARGPRAYRLAVMHPAGQRAGYVFLWRAGGSSPGEPAECEVWLTIDLHQPYMVESTVLRLEACSPRLGMPSSATRTFTDPDMYFAGIRNLQIDG
jgi:hypothetical protein